MSDENKLKKVIRKIIKEYISDNPPEDQLKFGSISSSKTYGDGYLYSVKILDQNNELDSNFPIIPDVKDKNIYNNGDIVVIGILYGGQIFQIFKKVEE